VMRRSSRRLTLGVSHEFPVNKKITQGTRLRGSEALLKRTEKELGKSRRTGPAPPRDGCASPTTPGPMSITRGELLRADVEFKGAGLPVISALLMPPLGLCRSERSYSSLSAWGETWAGYEKEGRGRIR
jgi:hypothetical protein